MSIRLHRGLSRAAFLLGLLALTASVATAQQFRGRVVLEKEAVGGVPVMLHQVTPDSSGPIGTAATGADGGFAFVLPPADSAAGFRVFFVTAEFRGIRHFGPPLHPGDPGTGYAVEVFDTASASRFPGAVEVARRDVIVLPEEDGSAEVEEIVRVRNTARRTLVTGSGPATWELRLPEGVVAFEAGEGQIPSQGVQRMGRRVLVTAPLTPGEQDLFIRYRLERGATRTVLPLAAGTDTMNLFIRQPAADATVTGLGSGIAMQAAGESFLRYTGAGLGSTEAVTVAWDRPGPPPVDPRLAAVVVTGVVLTAGAGLALRRRRPAA